MKSRKIAFIVAPLLFCFNVLCFATVQKVHHFTLENGLEVHIIQDKSLPIIAHTLLYKVGSANDPKGKSGLAHYLEHLMFRSTKNIDNVSNKLHDIFSKFNAMTSAYFTIYHELVTDDQIDEVMKLESDRMVNLKITDNAADLERKIVLEERKMRIDSSAESLLEEEMLATFYRNDKSWQTAGWEKEILTLNTNDAINMYKKFYNPSNAVLILVGNIDLDKTKTKINKYYGTLKSNHVVSTLILEEPDHRSDIKIYMDNKIDKISTINYLFPAPNITDDDHLATLLAY